MSNNNDWETRYSFRLTNEDQELGSLLANVPKNKRSEVIRKMLRYAYNGITNEKNEKEQIKSLHEEIKRLNEVVLKNHEEILRKLEAGIVMKGSPEDDDEKISEEAIEDSAFAMLTSFGIEID